MKTTVLFSAALICLFGRARPNDNVRVKRSDDVLLSSLQATVEQQTTLIQSLQAELEAEKNKVSGVETEVANLKSQVATLTKTVAFTVRFTADDNADGVPVGNNSPLRFDKVAVNVGNGYNAQTGIFTAPVAGLYCFFLTQMGAGNHGFVDLAIVKHGVVLDLVYSRDDTDQGSGLVTSHVAAGEQVWIRHYLGEAVRGAWYTVFTGYLLNADV